MNKAIAIVQARMSSSRLPGKMLYPLAGKPVIYQVFHQLSFSKKIDEIVLATSNEKSDDPLQQWAENKKKKYYRGSLQNVLKRYYDTAKYYNADIIVRITGDCPLIDPSLVDNIIEKFYEGNYDYYSNTNPPTFPDGLDTEVFTFAALENAFRNAKHKSELEHVTVYLRNHSEIFNIGNYQSKKNLNKLRWTLDNPEDYKFLSIIFDSLYNKNTYIDSKIVVEFLNQNREILRINEKFYRNEGYDLSLKRDIN